jgi:hypothetical protein
MSNQNILGMTALLTGGVALLPKMWKHPGMIRTTNSTKEMNTLPMTIKCNTMTTTPIPTLSTPFRTHIINHTLPPIFHPLPSQISSQHTLPPISQEPKLTNTLPTIHKTLLIHKPQTTIPNQMPTNTLIHTNTNHNLHQTTHHKTLVRMRPAKGTMLNLLVDLEEQISSLTEASTREVIETMVSTEKLSSTNLLPEHQKWTFQNLMAVIPKNGFA